MGSSIDEQKRQAAMAALGHVTDGMLLGLGTGSTAAKFVEALGARVAEGLQVIGVPTSEATRLQAEALHIPLSTLDDHPRLDLTVDGADELDGQLRLIKGGGGALLREKIVACASDRMIVVADASKRVETLGAFPLPIEIDRFGMRATQALIEKAARAAGAAGRIAQRRHDNGRPYMTDGGNFIFDCHFARILDPETLAAGLDTAPGVVGHGLFIGIATLAIVGGPDGVERIEPAAALA